MKEKKLQLKKNIISKLTTFFIVGGINTSIPCIPPPPCTRLNGYSCDTSDGPISNPKGEKTEMVIQTNTNINTTST